MKSIRTSDAIGPSDGRDGGRAYHEVLRGPEGQDRMKSEPIVCRTCGAFFRAGRWQWLPLPARQATRRVRCPPCLRIRDDDSAGFLTLVGGFVGPHSEEICSLIRLQEEVHRRRDSQSRIVSLRRLLGRIVVATTDSALPCKIGEAVVQAYGGKLHVMREKEGGVIRVRWLDGEIVTPYPSKGATTDRRAACTFTRSQRTTTVRWPSTERSALRPSMR